MKFQSSEHFLLLHDTTDAKDRFSKKTRAEERLELLETVFSSFLLKFSLEGYDLEVPKQRLKVVLFAEKEDYLRFVDLLGPSLSKAAGFYDRKNNISVFFDQGSDESFEALYQLNTELQEQKRSMMKDRWPPAPGMSCDWQTPFVVDRSGTRKPRYRSRIARGHAPPGGQYGAHAGRCSRPGVGCRRARYLLRVAQAGGLERHRFRQQGTPGLVQGFRGRQRAFQHRLHRLGPDLFAGGFAGIHAPWLRTGLGIDTLPDGQALRQAAQVVPADCQEKPAGKPLSDKELVESFDEVFGKDKSALDLEWRQYMRTLKTDLQLVLEDKD